MRFTKVFFGIALLVGGQGFISDAHAGERSGYLFGQPVTFEVGAAYGGVNNISAELLTGVDGTLFSIPASVTAEDRAYASNINVFCFVPCGHAYRTAGFSADVTDGLESVRGYNKALNFNFGFSTELSDSTRAYARFDISRLSSTNAMQELNINASVQSEVGPLTNIIDGQNPTFNGNGTILTTTHNGVANVSVSFDTTNIYGMELGIRQDVFPVLSLGGANIQPFLDVGAGFSYATGIDASISGNVPDFSDQPANLLVTSGLTGTNPTLVNVPGSNVAIETAFSESKLQILDSDIRPRLSLGAGITAAISDDIKLTIEARHTRMGLGGNSGAPKIKLKTNLVGARLSRVF